ncbi:odorant-binding protein 56h [Cochliomyia hominivorax]
MKFYILFIAAVVMVAQVKCDMKEDFHKADMACREESKVSEDELKTYFKGEMKEEPKDALKCHLKCLMEKQGHWKNGAFDENAAMKFLQAIPSLKDQQDAINKAMMDCKSNKGANECDTAFMIIKCMAEHKASMM